MFFFRLHHNDMVASHALYCFYKHLRRLDPNSSSSRHKGSSGTPIFVFAGVDHKISKADARRRSFAKASGTIVDAATPCFNLLRGK